MNINFDTNFFQKRKCEQRIVERYFRNGIKDFRIASRGTYPEIIFVFSYSALIKIGIALIAFCGYRVKSRTGHHIKILEKMAEILKNEDIMVMGDRMRKKRNLDLYEGGIILSHKEAAEYLEFVKQTIKKAETILKSQKPLF